jgi:flagellar biosynthesis/type III secretory pathway M-ring protein FliF/YscJ
MIYLAKIKSFLSSFWVFIVGAIGVMLTIVFKYQSSKIERQEEKIENMEESAHTDKMLAEDLAEERSFEEGVQHFDEMSDSKNGKIEKEEIETDPISGFSRSIYKF